VEHPGEVENPGEHRASGGLNTRLGTTNSRGEQGPEDEPYSQRTACLRSECLRTSVREQEERRTPGLKAWRQLRLVAREGRATVAEAQASVPSTTAYRRPSDPAVGRGTSRARTPPQESESLRRPALRATTATGIRWQLAREHDSSFGCWRALRDRREGGTGQRRKGHCLPLDEQQVEPDDWPGS
jgi:hypothetical protein